jgi:glycosyltransferase involved in cell wall biosynthesis
VSETPELAVIVFAYNEAHNVPVVLLELRQWLDANAPSTEIVFVDDGSTDDSYAAAAAALRGTPHHLCRHEKNRGIGAAIKTGFAASLARSLTFMPADGQIAPEAIGVLRDEARRTGADVVLSVYDHRDDGFKRKILSWGVRALILAVHGVRMRSDGPYFFRREVFDAQSLRPDSFFLNFEFPIRARVRKLRTSTVTIACRPRQSGVSKSSGLRTIKIIGRDLIELKLRRMREDW